MKPPIVALLLLLVGGCISTSPEASSIIVHQQYSTLLDDCENLGPVQVESRSIPDYAEEQALSDLREMVYQMGGDSVALVNLESKFMGARLQGVAFRCSPRE